MRYLSIILHRSWFLIISMTERFLWRMHGVLLGKGARFSGWCYLNKIKGAKIQIGNHVHFVSSPFVNHIGLNRKCSLSALTPEARLVIGDNCGFSSTNISAFKEIVLGNNVRVGANTMIMDSDFHTDDPRTGPNRPVRIDDNVWLGTNVTVLKGVHIGENSVIGAGSVVTKNIPANVVAAGNPCRVIKSICV